MLTETEYEELQRLRGMASREPSMAGKPTQIASESSTPKCEKFGRAIRERKQKDIERAEAESVRRAKLDATASQESISSSKSCTPKSKNLGGSQKLQKRVTEMQRHANSVRRAKIGAMVSQKSNSI